MQKEVVFRGPRYGVCFPQFMHSAFPKSFSYIISFNGRISQKDCKKTVPWKNGQIKKLPIQLHDHPVPGRAFTGWILGIKV